jgi:SAM domain (Sterile alpha motif)
LQKLWFKIRDRKGDQIIMPISRVNSQVSDEDRDKSWVIVRRQKINILIPPPSPQNIQETTDISTEDGSFVERSLPYVNTQFGIRWTRFLNFKERIKKLGGIKTWLLSNGFQRFIPVFEREKLSLHQLFVISMETLKRMGVMPVGPRRKLVHAVEKLSQPL